MWSGLFIILVRHLYNVKSDQCGYVRSGLHALVAQFICSTPITKAYRMHCAGGEGKTKKS